jgi:hypothetical protein
MIVLVINTISIGLGCWLLSDYIGTKAAGGVFLIACTFVQGVSLTVDSIGRK